MSTVRYIDTTLRDLAAHPWGGSVDTEEIAAVASGLARSGAAVIEVLDAFSARGALEGRAESPWDRLRATVRAAGTVPVGIVISAQTLFGARPSDAATARALVLNACESGARRVRIVDALNNVETLTPLAEAAVQGGAELVPTLMLGPVPLAKDARWMDEARAIAALPGASSVCLVDRAGHLRPAELAALIPQIIDATGLPVEVSVVGPGALAPVAAVAAIEAGASAVQAAVGAAALGGARPTVETLRAALAGGDHALDCDRAVILELGSTIWSLVPPDRLRQTQVATAGPVLGLPLDLAAGLHARLARLGLSSRLLDAADEVVRVAAECGNVTLAYPLGSAVVSQAVQHVIDEERWADIEPVLVDAINGEFGPLRGPVADAPRRAAESAGSGPGSASEEDVTVADAPAGLADEDKLLWAMFPETSQRLFDRRRSLVDDAAGGTAAPTVDRALIESLVDVVENAAQAEVSVEVGGARVTVRRAGAAPVGARPTGEAAPPAAEDDSRVRVESPIVGTFYSAPSPEAPPFVSVGDRVSVGQTLCIIEAMKIFNEIVAEAEGVIRSIDVQNSEGVEFGTLLFTIEP